MNSELKILKTIWENEGKSSIGLISDQLGFGIDYTYYLCTCLLKKGQIKPVKGKRNWYEISSKGERGLRLRGIIKPKIPKRARGSKEVVYYFPKKIEATLSKVGFQKTTIKKPEGNLIEVYPPKFYSPAQISPKFVAGKGKLGRAREKTLNLGRKIEKAVSFLRSL